MAKASKSNNTWNNTDSPTWNFLSKCLPCHLLISVVLLSSILHFPVESFDPHFIWSAVNKSLHEDRLPILDTNNERIRSQACTKVVLFNSGSESYLQGNYSGNAVLVDTSNTGFATDKVRNELQEKMTAINLGICIPCIVIISIVNISSVTEEKAYRILDSSIPQDTQKWDKEESIFQNYKFQMSLNLAALLQFKTPIQNRYLIIVRLVENQDDLNKCHGKKYTKYPRRLVPIWEQVLFDHFKEARVLQGSTDKDSNEHTLISAKETAAWVWMCQEINRRLELENTCKKKKIIEEKCQLWESGGNFSTSTVDMTDRDQCGTYRPRT